MGKRGGSKKGITKKRGGSKRGITPCNPDVAKKVEKICSFFTKHGGKKEGPKKRIIATRRNITANYIRGEGFCIDICVGAGGRSFSLTGGGTGTLSPETYMR